MYEILLSVIWFIFVDYDNLGDRIGYRLEENDLLSYFLFCLRRIVQHERYGVLTLINTTGADTGEYTCYPMFCEDTDCRKNYDKASKVFVFFPGMVKSQHYNIKVFHFTTIMIVTRC